ncbi:winged helix-turn-helix domain-containing protein [Sphingomonas astaxanthinifaciens]|uniref:OmpR/PhoB-type domain-containing protein n=1 Tax=Sphingomonas astaxanthinifaciens DSM 22298 TaxID=1123267 RepID=A0ABQ5Z3P3_9SPHN|nr:winged helix-turn-helix domain-containing protein [Sphingomonas astaxanthinifaciens]GLR46641.1 hypothetical protein GCM10007925_03520 [Sphingomonas astaxanthinifaciens DSM 22298]
MDAPTTALSPIVLAREPGFRIGRVEVRPETCELVSDEGNRVLEPRVMQVLVALHQAGGHVVSRDDLLARCWSGRIVGEDAIHRVISRLRHEAEAVGGPFRVETITRVGYRMVETGAGERPPLPERRAGIDRRTWLAGAGGVALLGGAGLSAWRWRHPAMPAAARAKLEEGGRQSALGTVEGAAAALAAYKEAAALAPDHAEPWGELALSYTQEAQRGSPAQSLEAVNNARQAIARARAIDPDSPEAEAASIGLSMGNRRPDLLEVDRRLTRARQKHPDERLFPEMQCYFYAQVGRLGQALAAFDVLMGFLPDLPAVPAAARLYVMNNVGRVEEADRAMQQLLERFPRNIPVWFSAIKMLTYSGRFDRALAMLDDVNRRPIGVPKWNFALTRTQVLGLSQPTDYRERARRDTLDSARRGTGFAENAILFLAAIGDLDSAFGVANALYLDEGYRIGAQRFTSEQGLYDNRWRRTSVLFERTTAPLRADPRFLHLTRSLGLERYWKLGGTGPDYRA